MPTLQSQVTISGILPAEQNWSDFQDSRSSFIARLASGITIEVALPDGLSGIRPRKQVNVQVENVAANTSDLTLADLTAAGPIDGATVVAKLVDLSTSTTLLRTNGSIRSLDEAQGNFTVEEVESSMLQQLLPKRRVIDLFASADLTRGGQDPRVIWCFKEVRQAPLIHCQAFGGTGADYGVIRKPSTGTLTVVSVYVNKAVADPTAWSRVELVIGGQSYYVIRFTRVPTDGSGQEAEIRVDLTSTEYATPSDVGKAILSDATFGLGKSVANASFTTAAADYVAASYSAGGGIGPEPLQAGDILNLLCLRGAAIGKNNAGNYTWVVDKSSLHVQSQYNGRNYALGRGDGQWENIDKVLTKSRKPIESRINDYTLQGLRTEGFGKEAYLISARSTRAVTGTPKLETNRFIGDTTTLSKEVGYRMARMAAEENVLGVEVDAEASVINLNETVPVTVPYLRLSTTNPALPWMVRRIVGSASKWELGLVGYDSAQYAATAGTVQSAGAASYLTDYSFTYPGLCTGFQIVPGGETFRLSDSGAYELATELEATPPTVNVTHLSFRARVRGSILFAETVDVPCTPGGPAVRGMLLKLRGGLRYDYLVFAINVNNDPAFQVGLTGPSVQILNHQAATDPTAFTAPTGVHLTQGTDKSLQAHWDAHPSTEKGVHYRIRLSTNGGAFNVVDEEHKGRTWTYADTSLAYSSTYRVSVSSLTPFGVESAQTLSVETVNLGRVPKPDLNGGFPFPNGDLAGHPWNTGDYNDNSVTSGKRQIVNSQAASPAIADGRHAHTENNVLGGNTGFSSPIGNFGVLTINHNSGRVYVVTSRCSFAGLPSHVTINDTVNIVVSAMNMGAPATPTITAFYW